MEELKERVKEILRNNGILNKEQCEEELAQLLEGAAATTVPTLIIEAYNQGIDVFYVTCQKQKEKLEELNCLLDKVKDKVFNKFLEEQ